MIANRVDPRDERWEDRHPVFRVHFWKDNGESDEFEVRDADVNEVLRWAEEKRLGRTFALYLRRDETNGPGLVLLAGVDPSANPTLR